MSLSDECHPVRDGGEAPCGLNWGVADFATIALPGGIHAPIPKPRLGQEAERDIRIASRAASRKNTGSNNRRKAVRHLGRFRQRRANRRRDFAHQEYAKPELSI